MKFIETLDSSATKIVAYEHSQAQLYVVFNNTPEKVYVYVALPNDYIDITASQSRGRAVQAFVKDRDFTIISADEFEQMIITATANNILATNPLRANFNPILAWV